MTTACAKDEAYLRCTFSATKRLSSLKAKQNDSKCHKIACFKAMEEVHPPHLAARLSSSAVLLVLLLCEFRAGLCCNVRQWLTSDSNSNVT
jgi:hypothetical protein